MEAWDAAFMAAMFSSACMKPEVEAQKPESDEAASDDAEAIERMLRVKTGDTEAFEWLVRRYRNSVIGTVYRMLGDQEEAHDIAQQVFVRVWKSASRYKPNAKFTTWLFTITRNLVYNETRRRKRRPQCSLEEQQETHHLSIPDRSVGQPDDNVLQAEMREAVDSAMTRLPGKQRMAVVLRRFEMLSYDEIGDVMNLSVSAVKSLLFRARSQIREELRDYLKDGE